MQVIDQLQDKLDQVKIEYEWDRERIEADYANTVREAENLRTKRLYELELEYKKEMQDIEAFYKVVADE